LSHHRRRCVGTDDWTGWCGCETGRPG
jgi:hypothetical protein